MRNRFRDVFPSRKTALEFNIATLPDGLKLRVDADQQGIAREKGRLQAAQESCGGWLRAACDRSGFDQTAVRWIYLNYEAHEKTDFHIDSFADAGAALEEQDEQRFRRSRSGRSELRIKVLNSKKGAEAPTAAILIVPLPGAELVFA
jgi:hypothetical protein